MASNEDVTPEAKTIEKNENTENLESDTTSTQNCESKTTENHESGTTENHEPGTTENHESDTKDTHNFLLTTLDEIERQVEELRDNAKKMEEQKKSMLSSLDTLMQSQAIVDLSQADRDELEIYIDRLIKRCLTVEITVQIIRSPAQEKSLETVLKYLHDLIGEIHTNMEQSRGTIERYLNSCLTEISGPVDDKFQASLLGCTAEDQKDVKKRLEVLWGSLERETKRESK